MSNPTDTNQASEDEMRKGIIGELSRVQLYAKDHPYSVTATDESDIEKAADAIQSLIRTEKLKLLAAVRERVVGEYSKYPGHYTLSDVLHDQRVVLTNLEAEL